MFKRIVLNVYFEGFNLKNKKIFRVFFREKPAMVLVNLFTSSTQHYASSIAKVVDCTYSHIIKILGEMQKADLVTFQKQGRLKYLKLTKKGEEVASYIDKIRNSL